jgi:hypothetical protein
VEDGYCKLDEIRPLPIPTAALPDATIIEARPADTPVTLPDRMVPAGKPIIFRVTNDAAAGKAYCLVLAYPAGMTAEQLIAGTVDLLAPTAAFGDVSPGPGQTADLAFTLLEPGPYFLVCAFATGDRTPGNQLDVRLAGRYTVEQATGERDGSGGRTRGAKPWTIKALLRYPVRSAAAATWKLEETKTGGRTAPVTPSRRSVLPPSVRRGRCRSVTFSRRPTCR